MKLRSIYFLQALWDIELQRDELLQISKNAMISEIEKAYIGVLNPETIWVSQKSLKLLEKIESLKKRVNTITRPIDLRDINDDFISITGQVRALQIKTAQTLDAQSGVLLEDLHIIVRQLLPYTGKKIYEQAHYQLFRLMVLGYNIPDQICVIPNANETKMVLNYYVQGLMPLIDNIESSKLDSRWAYERKTILLNGELSIEQFVMAEPRQDELEQPLGIPSIGIGTNGEFRIHGRGLITNIIPMEITERVIKSVSRKIPETTDFSLVSNENTNPMETLKDLFGNRKYLVAPNEYFELINRKLIASDFYRRIRTGSCFYCGAPLYANRCSKCGRKWNI